MAFLGSCVYIDRGKKALYRLRHKVFQIPDPRAKKQIVTADTLPLIEITALSIDSNVGCWYFHLDKPDPGSLRKFSLPTVTYTDHSFADTVQLAEKLLAEHDNPLGGN